MATSNPGAADAERVAREITQINDMVTAVTMNIDPSNMAMLNDRLTQMRLRKESLEEELRMARAASADHDAAELRRLSVARISDDGSARDPRRKRKAPPTR